MFEQKRAYWRSLDNAAKLFSAASSPKDTRVFRFYCELKEEVEENVLQEALDQTIEKYPVFLSVMRKGLFWHYLEKSELRPIVRKEYKEPCSSLYVRDKKTLLFEVTYYKKRINFEVFHALTDGTGATEFLRELVKNYLYLIHEEDLEPVELSNQYLTVKDQEDDSFSRYYDPDFPRKKKKKIRAVQIKKGGKGYEELQINEASMSVKELLGIAREKKVSMSVLLTAAFICAIHEEMSRMQEKKPVILMVPVNLRKIFPSDSMLNFFGYIEPGYQFGGGKDSFEDVLLGTTAIAVSNDDQTAAARILGKFAESKPETFNLKAGYVDGVAYDTAGVMALSKIPSKDVLLAQLVGSLQGPLRKLAATLQALADKKNEEEAA